jgi:hypothetical protein
VTHIDRVRALLNELNSALDQLEASASDLRKAAVKPPRKAKRRNNVDRAIVEARRAARKGQ